MFIVITGGDKCGKTTQCGLLAGRLREYGAKVFEAKVPGGDTLIGKDIQKLLNSIKQEKFTSLGYDEARRLEALFVVDRLLTEQKIAKAEKDGDIVVCSRWVESAAAYSRACGFEEEWHQLLIASTRKPDLLILIDVAESIYVARANRSGAPDLYDHDADLQNNVRLFLRHYPGIVKVDGSRTSDEVAESVWKVVVSKLLSKAANTEACDNYLAEQDLKKLVRPTQTSSCDPGVLK